jgi:hypothetical protein
MDRQTLSTGAGRLSSLHCLETTRNSSRQHGTLPTYTVSTDSLHHRFHISPIFAVSQTSWSRDRRRPCVSASTGTRSRAPKSQKMPGTCTHDGEAPAFPQPAEKPGCSRHAPRVRAGTAWASVIRPIQWDPEGVYPPTSPRNPGVARHAPRVRACTAWASVIRPIQWDPEGVGVWGQGATELLQSQPLRIVTCTGSALLSDIVYPSSTPSISP